MILTSLCACNDDIDMPGTTAETTETTDDWQGNENLIQLHDGTDSINTGNITFTIHIQAPDNCIIKRECTFSRNSTHSELHLSKGLKAGEYRLLYLEYEPSNSNGDSHKTQYGLGCRIKLGSGLTDILDNYNSDLELYGSGTDENPYIITSYTHLMTLASKVNSKETNPLITSSTWFKQYIPLDLSYASFKCDNNYGWMPIGNSTEPFRGKFIGNETSGLWIKRPNSFGLGLFGCIDNAFIQNVRITDAEIEGNFAVGAVAGAVITRGDQRDCSSISDCNINRCTINGSAGSLNVGGITGAVDMLAKANFYNCHTDASSISSSYNAGGIVGGCGMYSYVSINSCQNNSQVTTEYAGAGGIIATGDTLSVTGCTNSGLITGATRYTAGDTHNSGRGTGGIVGGCGMSTIVSCVNTETGDVTGKDGVGGILGSTKIAGDDNTANIYNSVILRYCGNHAEIKGTQCVGGICGEAQMGGYALYNRGTVSGTDYIAGIAGCTSANMLVNAVNSGTISGETHISGVSGKTNMGNYAICQNYGGITGKERVAGVLGLGSNNTMIHYCGNFGTVTGNCPVGGIVGEIGEEREWTGMNIAECVVGAIDIVLGVASPTFMIMTDFAATGILHGVHIALELAEVCTIDVEWVLFGIGVHELCGEHAAHEMEAAIEATAQTINSDITAEINDIRGNASPAVNNKFTTDAMKNNYLDNILAQNDFYAASDENADLFNDNINHLRHERSEAIEEKMEQKEHTHTIVSGIAVAVSTIGAIGSIVLSGGAAAPFFIAGSLGAIVGGMNAVIKGATHYSENSVIIWQCANSGNISGSDSDETGGIAGIVHDMSIVRDCINTAEGTCGGSIVGTLKNEATAYCNLSISDSGWDDMFAKTVTAGEFSHNYQYSSSGSNGINYSGLTASEIADPSNFSGWDFSNKWTIPSGYSNSYPIPNVSDMKLSH